ncbi:MAG TPA: type II secretion system major pseudopilin GspG [Chthonomonadales bacterium]|nr:type II secretion system major pseudopilin GspG [Chthonomonadales bacterium]
MSKSRLSRSAFTLIELIVVVVILAILALVVAPRILGRAEDARVSSAITTIRAFDNALELYNADTGKYPTTDQGLAALVTNPGVPNWKGPYLKNQDKVPPDPWGHPYRYKQPGESNRDYDLSSDGPDGQPSTDDDIQGWNLQKQSGS